VHGEIHRRVHRRRRGSPSSGAPRAAPAAEPHPQHRRLRARRGSHGSTPWVAGIGAWRQTVRTGPGFMLGERGFGRLGVRRRWFGFVWAVGYEATKVEGGRRRRGCLCFYRLGRGCVLSLSPGRRRGQPGKEDVRPRGPRGLRAERAGRWRGGVGALFVRVK
jgi:hypothetical protein